jgi:hypothetical protein
MTARCSLPRPPAAGGISRLALAVLLFIAALCPGLSPGVSAQSPPASIMIDEAVRREDAELVTESVRLAEDFFTGQIGATIDRQVHVNVRPDALSENPGVLAMAVGRSVIVYTGSPAWRQSSPAEKVATIVHEYTHFYQYLMTGRTHSISPAWLEEGIAQYLSLLALDRLRIIDQADIESWYAGWLMIYLPDRTLAELESHSAFDAMTGGAYELAYFAVAELFQASGLDAVQTYYGVIGSGASFETAMERAFGISPTELEARIATRLATLSGAESEPNDVAVVTGIARESPVRFTGLPAAAGPDEQIVVRARTVEASSCRLSLSAAGGQTLLERGSFADGAGDVFWLVTVPADAPLGLATLHLDCGGPASSRAILLS